MADFDAMRRELRQQVAITARRTAIEWETNVQDDAPYDTGQLRRSVRMRDFPTSDGWRIEGETDTPYDVFVSQGTRPHVIRPRRARALRFTVGGETVFAMKVNHPGTMPNDFWTANVDDLPRLVETIWGQVTR